MGLSEPLRIEHAHVLGLLDVVTEEAHGGLLRVVQPGDLVLLRCDGDEQRSLVLVKCACVEGGADVRECA